MTLSAWRTSLVQVLTVSACLLALPLALTLINPNARLNGGAGGGFDWGIGSFLVMGAMLIAAGLALQIARRKIKAPAPRLLTAAAIIFVFVLIWAELAVGGLSQLLGG